MAFKLLIVILITSYNCLADNEIPTFSIITDASPGVSVLHGLTKLTDALQAKRITFEKIRSIKEARGAIIIVAGLSSGANDAAKILKEGNRSLPETSEALTIWKTNYQNKSVWVISGFDDSGLMYGLQDVAIQISWSINPENPMSEVKEITEKPDVSERAISLYTMNRAYLRSGQIFSR